tara:strand:- start:159 stop:584 length:426 start_codon:yes stop_codon:yes gene_type:complete
MLGMIALVIKLIIGGVASYVLPSVSIENISEKDHFKILCLGIFTTSLFSISYNIDSSSPYILSAAALVFIGFLSFRLSDGMKLNEKILLFGCVLIGLNIGFGYILQGIILSFLVYYITNNRADLFTLLSNNKDDSEEDNTN